MKRPSSAAAPAAEGLNLGACVACERTGQYVELIRSGGFDLLVCRNGPDCREHEPVQVTR